MSAGRVAKVSDPFRLADVVAGRLGCPKNRGRDRRICALESWNVTLSEMTAWTTTTRPAHARAALSITWPRMHGAWSVLLCGYVAGVAAAGVPGPASLVLLASVVAAFVGRHAASVFDRLTTLDPRRRWVGLWGSAYAVLSVVGLSVLVVWFNLSGLLVLAAAGSLFAVASLILESRRKDRTLAGELINIVGLSLAAPAAMYVTSGVFDFGTVGLWLLSVMFFAGRVLHVRYVVGLQRAGGADGRTRLEQRISLAYQVVILLAACVVSAFGALPAWSPLALLPGLVKALWGLPRRHDAPISIRRLGYNEVWLALLFVCLTAVSWHMPGLAVAF